MGPVERELGLGRVQSSVAFSRALLARPWPGHGNSGLALVLLFVLLYGMGNGMQTIVKGTAIAQYVNRDHVVSLNGALGLPLALARAAAPLAMGFFRARKPVTATVCGSCWA